MLLLPMVFLLFVAYFAAAPVLLRRLGRCSLPALLSLGFAISPVFAGLMSVNGFRDFWSVRRRRDVRHLLGVRRGELRDGIVRVVAHRPRADRA
jgi:ABC-type sulfate transport system permease subunit